MRPIISYDDISYDDPPAEQVTSEPPMKRQKKKHRKSNGHQQRELTQAEVWDDSALIDAWNAATEEYEAYHGPGKGWKNEPVTKSSLWYNVPRSVSTNEDMSADELEDSEEAAEGNNSKPLDFDTFVPTHDPSLTLPTLEQPPPIPGPDFSSYYLPTPPGPMVSKDEAFTRALGAMYWGGYWTAMYHCQSAAAAAVEKSEIKEEQDDEMMEFDEEEEEKEGLVSTQRDPM